MLRDLPAGALQLIAMDMDGVRFMVVVSVEGVADDRKLLSETSCPSWSTKVQPKMEGIGVRNLLIV